MRRFMWMPVAAGYDSPRTRWPSLGLHARRWPALPLLWGFAAAVLLAVVLAPGQSYACQEFGESCGFRRCCSGLSCGPLGNKKCFHVPRREGEPCSIFNKCGSGLCCGFDSKCKKAGTSGQPCASCPDRACADGLSCGPIGDQTCYHVPRQAGEPCSAFNTCGSGLSCGPAGNQVCFHKPRLEGEPCSSTACADGLCCGGNLTCKVEGNIHEPCGCPGRLDDGGCLPGLSCGPSSDDPRICYRRPRQLGDPCSLFNNCAEGLSCGPPGDQVCFHSPRELGEPCSAFNPCGDGLFCSILTFQCEERAGLGESCSGSRPCLEELSCGPLHDRKCYRVPREYRDPCSAFNQCGPGLTCQPGVQRCFNDPRQLEEPCSAGFPCEDGLTCQPGVQKCFPDPRELGQPCSAGFECGDGLSCQPGVQRCFHVPRQFEEPCSLGFPCDDGLNCQPGVQRCYHVPRRYEEPCSLGFRCQDCLSCQPGVHRCYNHPRTAGEPCSLGFPCGDEGFICHPLLLRCTPPEALDPTDPAACANLYDERQAATAASLGKTIGFSLGLASNIGGFAASVEAGTVYGENGEFGCFEAECLGGATDLASGEVFFTFAVVRSWSDFAGEALVTSGGGGLPFIEVGASEGQIFSTGFEELLGTAHSFSVGFGGNPVDFGLATCSTTVYQIDEEDLPDPQPRLECGCVDSDDTTDSDGDGTPDCSDLCPDDPNRTAPGTCGACGDEVLDGDEDGLEDCEDACPEDGTKIEAGDCGCGVEDTDTDEDGTADCLDECPDEPSATVAGDCDCVPDDVDTDEDGQIDCEDGCPNDPVKTEPGLCGCGAVEASRVEDCADACPDDESKTAPGVCGCGTPDPLSAQDPVVSCTDGQNECAGALTAVTTSATAVDQCGNDLIPSTNDGDRFGPGSHTVVWSATDEDSNTGSCTATATVLDTLPPTLTCTSGAAECTGPLTAVSVSAEALDECEGPLDVAPDTFGPFPAGFTLVTFTATDASGHTGSCTALAEVIDTVPPTVACEGDTQECSGALTPVTTSCGGSDNCDGDLDTESTAQASYPLGSSTFSCSVVDDTGNGETVDCEVVIVDTTPPQITCPANISRETTPGTCSLSVAYAVTASDACDGSPTVTCTDQDGGAVSPSGDTFPVGDTTVSCTATDGSGNSSSCSFAVEVNDPPQITAITPASQTVQYSDTISPVTVTATDCGPGPLTLASSGVPSALTLPAAATSCGPTSNGVTCTFTLSGQVRVPSGSFPVTVTPADEKSLSGSSSSIGLQVAAENARAVLSSSNPVLVDVAAPGGDSVAFTLNASIEELVPDTAGNTALAGDIKNAVVTLALVPVGPGSSSSVSCAATNTPPADTYGASGGVLEVSCDFDDLPVNTYQVVLEVGSDTDGVYYRGSTGDVLTVFDPSLGFTTGGGWFYWPGTSDRTNFGFNFKVKYNKKKTNVQGSLLLIRHLPDDTKYRVKSNALEGLSLGDSGDFGWAAIGGKSTYLEPGWADAVGNHFFIAYVEDHDEPGAGVDRFWIEVQDKDGNLVILAMPDDAVTNAVTIHGGNIVVPHTNKKRGR